MCFRFNVNGKYFKTVILHFVVFIQESRKRWAKKSVVKNLMQILPYSLIPNVRQCRQSIKQGSKERQRDQVKEYKANKEIQKKVKKRRENDTLENWVKKNE